MADDATFALANFTPEVDLIGAGKSPPRVATDATTRTQINNAGCLFRGLSMRRLGDWRPELCAAVAIASVIPRTSS